MGLGPCALQQRLARRLDEDMLKDACRPRQHASLVQQFGFDEPRQRVLQRHLIQRRDRLQPGGQVGCLPEGQLFASGPAAHLTHHHQAGMDPQAHLEGPGTLCPSSGLAQACVQPSHGLHDPQPGPHQVVFGSVGYREDVSREGDDTAVASLRPADPAPSPGSLGVVATLYPTDMLTSPLLPGCACAVATLL